MRPKLLVLLFAVGSVLLASAPAAQAQGYPGWPPGYGGFPGGPRGFGGAPMMAPAASTDSSQASTPAASATVAADPTAPCRQSIANAAYPVANQMIYFAAAANLYPTTLNARPVVGPNQSYPFGGIFTQPGLPGLGLRNTLGGLNGFPPSASPPVVVNQVAANGFTNVVPIEVTNAAGVPQLQLVNVPSPADALTAAQVYQGQLGNLFAGVDATQGVFNTRIGAADLNIAMAGFPRAQASNLRDVLEGLLAYRDLACPAPASPSDDSVNTRLRASD